MKKLLAAVLSLLCVSTQSMAQQQVQGATVTISVADENGAVPGATVTISTKDGQQLASGTTDANGQLQLLMQVTGLVNKNKVRIVIEKKCDQQTGQNCKDRKREGFFWIFDGQKITGHLDTGAIESLNPRGGTSGATPTSAQGLTTGQAIGLQAGGGIGLDSISGVNSCSAPGVTGSACSTSNKAFAFDVGADLVVLKYLQVSGAYIRGNTTSRTIGASGSNSATDETQPQNESITVGPRFPIGPISLSAGGGVNFFQYHFTETANQTTSHFDVSGHGVAADGGVQFRISNRIAVQGIYRYLAATSQPTVNARDQKVMVRVMVRIF